MQPGTETRYAKSGDVHIAYRVFGNGPVDLVEVPGIVSHVEFIEEFPAHARYLQRLASIARVIVFDKRGNGMSDRVAGVPTLDERMDDIRAVMDSAGAERATIFGASEGGPLSMLFAATYPERTTGLVLWETFPRFVEGPDWPGIPEDQFRALVDTWVDNWGTGLETGLVPSLAGNEDSTRLWAKFQRLSASPATVRQQWAMIADTDVRDILGSIRVPTLVMHRRDSVLPVALSRYLAHKIRNSRLEILDGADHVAWLGNADTVVDLIQEFVTGERAAPVEDERFLATVLFTDIVDSTQRAAELGDRGWRDLLDQYDARVLRFIEQFRGRQVKSTGDGTLATFDGPARAVRCAAAIRDTVHRLDLDLRAGIHTGEIEPRGEDITGIGVVIASRVSALAKSGEILVSRTVKDLVAGSGLAFADKGIHALKGVPDEWQLYAFTN